jgi:hypothetical protein
MNPRADAPWLRVLSVIHRPALAIRPMDRVMEDISWLARSGVRTVKLVDGRSMRIPAALPPSGGMSPHWRRIVSFILRCLQTGWIRSHGRTGVGTSRKDPAGDGIQSIHRDVLTSVGETPIPKNMSQSGKTRCDEEPDFHLI